MTDWDSPNAQIAMLAAVGALLMALAVLGLIDMDDTKTNLPPQPAVYQHPEEP